jgi:hypothetical protein
MITHSFPKKTTFKRKVSCPNREAPAFPYLIFQAFPSLKIYRSVFGKNQACFIPSIGQVKSIPVHRICLVIRWIV